MKVYKTLLDKERSHRNLAKGYYSHEVLLKSDKEKEEIVLKSEADAELKAKDLEIKILREHLYTALTGLHDDAGKVIHEEMPRIDQEIREALNNKQSDKITEGTRK